MIPGKVFKKYITCSDRSFKKSAEILEMSTDNLEAIFLKNLDDSVFYEYLEKLEFFNTAPFVIHQKAFQEITSLKARLKIEKEQNVSHRILIKQLNKEILDLKKNIKMAV